MYTHRRKLRENENKLRTISLEISLDKVDQILGNETNSELWKASVLLLKWRESTLTDFLELMCLPWCNPPNWCLTCPINTQQHTWYEDNQKNSGGNMKNPEPGIIRRSWVPRTGKTIARTPLNPFQLMFVAFLVWSPKRCTILDDWSNKSN